MREMRSIRSRAALLTILVLSFSSVVSFGMEQALPIPASPAEVNFPASHCPPGDKEHVTQAIADMIKKPKNYADSASGGHGAFSAETNYLSPQGYLAFCLAAVEKRGNPVSPLADINALNPRRTAHVYTYDAMSHALKEHGIPNFWQTALNWESKRDYLASQKTGRVPRRLGRPEPIKGSIEWAYRRSHQGYARRLAKLRNAALRIAAHPAGAPAARARRHRPSRLLTFAYIDGKHKGTFKQEPDGSWTERDNQNIVHHFIVGGTGRDYYYLYDAGRHYWVAIKKAGGDVCLYRGDKIASADQWETLYTNVRLILQ